MTHVFISYSHADQPFATRLAAALPPLGLEPWIDKGGIHGGARWSTSIQQALDTCEALILVLSPESMASGNVEDEWQYVLDKGKPVVPVLLKPTDVHFQLGRIQHIDFHVQPFETALAHLAEGVRLGLESANAEPSVADAGDGVARVRATIGPPTGTVTFLFTDIEGSTERWEHHPDVMPSALERHDDLIREVVAAHSGYVFKTIGDAFCAAFARAGDALAAAVSAQRAIADESWSVFGDDFTPLVSRMGLHTGEATERGGDYFGPSVNRVARIEAAGHGGQVLLSSLARGLVEVGGLPAGCRLRDLGEHRLKDLRHAERISQVVVDGLPDVTKALRTAGELEARDRILVLDPGVSSDPSVGQPIVVSRTVPETLVTIENVIRRDNTGAVLTAEQVIAAARHKPADLREYRLGRIAEWSQPRYRLDGRFVGLSLLVDQGEEAVQGRWQAKEEQYDDLGDLLDATDDPAVVVLGPPGGGKSTLLRRLELDTAIRELRGDGEERVTFFISLSTYKPTRSGEPLSYPAEWLAERWSARAADLPPLDDLLAEGRVTLLLDALNEMPAADESDFHDRVSLWKDWLIRMVGEHSGNKVVFSCRSLDYSQPLSTPDLRVPQVRIEPLTDEQVKDFLALYSPGHRREIWTELEGSPQLEVLRSPYFLALLVEQVEATGEMPAGRAGLFTGFVRQALRREVERGGELFKPGALLASRDLKRLAGWKWKSAYDLPERGVLLPKLATLAHAMQSDRADGERSQVRIDVDDALELLDDPNDEALLAAGEALAVLDEDQAADELMYIHQLVQEYFAARELTKSPDPELVRVEWRSAELSPSVVEVIDSLDPGDPLPPLSGTGWEETTILAAAMSDDAPAFLRGVMETNLSLAGRAAAQPELMPLLEEDLLDEIRWALVERSRDAEADLRDRITCGYALCDLGDPRFERRSGEHGEYLLPPLVAIPGGTYPIGDDEPIEYIGGTTTTHVPQHEVKIAEFSIGRFPVTNAEWACFMDSGGYEDERWWDTEAGRDWRKGIGTSAGIHAGVRDWLVKLKAEPEMVDRFVEQGSWDETLHERWLLRFEMSEVELDEHLHELYPEERFTEPRYWRDTRYNHPAQPVVGVCWFEARAYLSWLSEQSDVVFRLPTEAEWEAAARGSDGGTHAYGDEFDRMKGNTSETHVRRQTPIGVFPDGDTPEGVTDMTGNVSDWTSSAFGRDDDVSEYGYPYDAEDGREAVQTGADVRRVMRGGGWGDDHAGARAAFRDLDHPGFRTNNYGFRVVLASASSPI